MNTCFLPLPQRLGKNVLGDLFEDFVDFFFLYRGEIFAGVKIYKATKGLFPTGIFILVVFEADNALIVHNMDCAMTFPYKQKHMQAIFSAFEAMLVRRCDQHSFEGLTGREARLEMRA